MGVIDHFRQAIGDEAAQLARGAGRIGKPFVRKALLDAIEVLNAHLRALDNGASNPKPAKMGAAVRARAARPATAPSRSRAALGPIERIVEVVAEEMGVDAARIRHASPRDMQPVFARQVCMYVAYSMFGLSYPQIALAFDKLDHSTAMYAYNRVAGSLKSGRLDAQIWSRITQRLSSREQRQTLAAGSAGTRRPADRSAQGRSYVSASEGG